MPVWSSEQSWSLATMWETGPKQPEWKWPRHSEVRADQRGDRGSSK